MLGKNKPRDRKNKILMIWASRDYQKANPQNLLRSSDLMRILVPWRAFGDLTKAQKLVPLHEQKLVDEEEAERQRRLKDIEDAYASLLEPLPSLKEELEALSQNTAAAALKAWTEAPDANNPHFGGLLAQWQKVEAGKQAKTQFNRAAKKQKDAYSARVKELKKTIKEFEKLVIERDAAEAEINEHANREIVHIHEAAADLVRICSDDVRAHKYFVVAGKEELTPNEFNLNMSRFVDTYDNGHRYVPLNEAMQVLSESEKRRREAMNVVRHAMEGCQQ